MSLSFVLDHGALRETVRHGVAVALVSLKVGCDRFGKIQFAHGALLWLGYTMSFAS